MVPETPDPPAARADTQPADAVARTGAVHCELCEAARFTHWYAEDDLCWVADCEVCIVPMVVWKQHGVAPPLSDLTHMEMVLSAAADQRFGRGKWSLDREMRQIPDHFHAHARDKDWHKLRSQRPLSRYTGVGEPRQER